MKRPRPSKHAVSVPWPDIDEGNLDNDQRRAIDLCWLIIEAASGGDLCSQLIMLDYLAALMLQQIFTRPDARMNPDEAATMHANHIMEINDRITALIAIAKARGDAH
jgi:hypothetical protein